MGVFKFLNITVIAICALSVMLFSSCATVPHSDEELNNLLLGPDPDFQSSPAFKRLVKRRPGTEDYEKARIDYLFERLSKSKYNFVRNEAVYSPVRAVMHIKWKYFRFRQEARTAEEFINNCASGSRISGRPYLIQYSKTEFYPLDLIFFNELRLLDDEFIRYQEKITQEFKALQKEKKALQSEEPFLTSPPMIAGSVPEERPAEEKMSHETTNSTENQ